MLCSKCAVDVIKAVRMLFAVMVEEIIHLGSATRMYQIVFFYIVVNNLKHRCVFVGVDNISDIQS